MPPSRLQQELRKKHSFDSPAQEAALNIWRTSDQYHNKFGRLLRKYGITPSQYNVLRILRGENRPLPSLDIACRMVQVVPAITGLVDRLEQQGLVRRDRSTEDRRVVYVQLTEKGGLLLAKLDKPVLDLHHRLMAHMSTAQIEQLTRLLEMAREKVEEVHE